MRDINEIMPKIPNMKWGALTNVRPTPSKVTEMDKIFPTNGKWHTVFEEENSVFIWKTDLEKRSKIMVIVITQLHTTFMVLLAIVPFFL